MPINKEAVRALLLPTLNTYITVNFSKIVNTCSYNIAVISLASCKYLNSNLIDTLNVHCILEALLILSPIVTIFDGHIEAILQSPTYMALKR